jgi:hypothetical protein
MRDIINSYYKIPSAVVRFNGQNLVDVLSIEVSRSIDNSVATATITTVNAPPGEPESKVTIELGYNDTNVLVFTGYADTITCDERENVYIIQCRDVLKKALDTFLVQEVAFGVDNEQGLYYYSTYSNINGGTFRQHIYPSLSALNSNHPETTTNYSNEGVFAHAVVQWLLVMCGFAEGSEIQVDNSNFWIGDIKPAKFHLMSVNDAITQIAELIGWRVFADRGGVVRFKKRPRNASAYPIWEYTLSNRNIISSNYSKSNTDLRNYVEVRGYGNIVSVARQPSPYIGNVPYRGVLIANDLIDTQQIADFMAARVLADLNRLKETFDLEVEGNPIIDTGQTIQINSVNNSGLFLVESVTHSISSEGFITKINCVNFPNDINYEEVPSEVVAHFNVSNLAVFGDPKYVAELDASLSYSTRGEIVRYIWTVGTNPAYETTEPKTWVTFDEVQITPPNFVTVNLQAIDNLNVSGTYASGITKNGLESSFGKKAKKRALYVAATTTAQGSLDGGLTWNVLSIPAISCAASNFGPNQQVIGSGYALFGCSNNTIHRTTDGCKTSTVVLSNAGSPVNFVSIDETDSRYAIAGTQGGRIYTSNNFGVNWNLITTFSFPILEVRFGWKNPNYIHVVGSGVGNVYHSFNGGGSWTRVHEQLNIANREQSGALTNYYSTPSGIVSILQGSLSHVNFQSSPGNINTHSVVVNDDKGVMAVGSNGQHWVMSGNVMVPTQLNSANAANYMIRDGEIAPVAYFAVPSGVGKTLNKNKTMEMLRLTPGPGRIVAYGPFADPPPVPGNLVVVFNRRPEFPTLWFRAPWYDGGIEGDLVYVYTASGWMMSLRGSLSTNYCSAVPGHFTTRVGSQINKLKFSSSGITAQQPWMTGINSNWFGFYWATYQGNSFFIFKPHLLDYPGTYITFYPNSLNLNSLTYNDYSYIHNVNLNGFFSLTRPGIYNPYEFCFERDSGSFTWSPSRIWRFNLVTRDSPQLFSASNYDKLDVFLFIEGDRTPIYYYNDSDSRNGQVYRLLTNTVERRLPHLEQYTNFWASVRKGYIYFRSSDTVYRAPKYGDGAPEVVVTLDDLYPDRSGTWYIHFFSVTPNPKSGQDFIAVAAGYYVGWYGHHIFFYSADSGKTWQRTPIYNPNAGTFSTPICYLVPNEDD